MKLRRLLCNIDAMSVLFKDDIVLGVMFQGKAISLFVYVLCPRAYRFWTTSCKTKPKKLYKKYGFMRFSFNPIMTAKVL
jgi:hypothetical protein